MTSDPKSTTQPSSGPRAQTRALAVTDATQRERALSALLPGTDTLNMVRQWGGLFAAAGFFKDARDEAQAAVKIMYGLELGYTPAEAMAGIYIIEGKPTLGVHLQAAKLRDSGIYDYKIAEHTEERCVIHFFNRTSDGTWEKFGESAFTLDEARAADLLRKDVWRKYPRNMLFARAMTNGIRFYVPNLFTMPVYTPEELVGDSVELSESGDIVDASVVAPALPSPARRERAPRQERASDGGGRQRGGTTVPQTPEEINDLPGLLTWAGNFRKAHGLPIANAAINEALEVEHPREIREKFEGRWAEAARLIMRHAGVEPPSDDDEPQSSLEERVAALDAEQRKAFDEQIELGMSPEDALTLALPDADADDVTAAAEAAEDDGESDAAAEE